MTALRSMMVASGTRVAGVGFGLAGVLCFSGTAPATRVAAPVFGATTLTLSRILIAAVLGAFTLALFGQWRWPGHRHLAGLLTMGLGLAVGFPLFLALAVERVPAYHGAVVIGLVPAATAVLSAARTGERPLVRFWLACGIGFAAVLGYALVAGGQGLNVADLWLVAAVISCAIGYVEGARTASAIGPVPALCWAMLLLSGPAAVALAVLGPRQVADSISAGAWVGVGYAGVFSMFIGSLAWYRGLAAGGTARIGQLNLGQPFLAIAWSALLLGEHITWPVPVAAAVVLVSMAVCLRSGPAATGSSDLAGQPGHKTAEDRRTRR